MSSTHRRKASRHGVNRHQARQSAVEVLYAWHVGGNDGADIARLLQDRLHERGKQDKEYLTLIVQGVSGQCDAIDGHLSKVLPHRSLGNVGAIELAVLRLACWELWQRRTASSRLQSAPNRKYRHHRSPTKGSMSG